MSLQPIFAKIRNSEKAAWWGSGFLGLLLILLAAIGGLIQNYLSGEDFLIYQYANALPHYEAWKQFFFQYGRLGEALYWNYQYEILGHQPILLHALSFVLLLVLSITASACFLNAWPRAGRTRALPYLFVFSLFLNWIFHKTVLRLSYDNGRLSMIFFFVAGLCLQRWAASQRRGWLLLSYVLFLISILTYENAAFLFPALVILSLPLLPANKRRSWRSQVALFIGFSAASALAVFVPYWLYKFMLQAGLGNVATPVRSLEFRVMFEQFVDTAPTIYLRFGQIINVGGGLWNTLVAAGVLSVLLMATVRIIRIHRGGEAQIEKAIKSRWTAIYFASLWLVVFGPLPYIFLGYGVGGRVYSSAIFGVFALLMMLYTDRRSGFFRITATVLLLLFAGLGLLTLFNESDIVRQEEIVGNIFYRGLKEAVPHVQSETVFFILDGPLGNSGCPASLEMLYNQNELSCAILSSRYEKYLAIRHEMGVETSGQKLDDNNWILILVDQDEVRVLDHISPGEHELLINWESTEPIRTNFDKIVTEDLPPPSPFYLHLLERARELFPEP